MRINLRPYQLLLVTTALVSSGYYVGKNRSEQQSADIARVTLTQQSLQDQQAQVEALREDAQEKLTGMIIKLGDMQAQIRRLDALGEKLAERANLPVEEFGFGAEPAVGGPTTELASYLVESSDDVIIGMNELLADLENKSMQLNALESILMSHHVDEQSYLAGRPVTAGWLSSYYGIRKDPFSGQPAMHNGLDFAGTEGDPVVATGAGLVTWSGERYGYGNLIEIDHGDGLVTRYGHNKEIKVALGDVVTKGQHIGIMGSTGRSTGAHVHYEVLRNGIQQDPLPYVSRN